ncbi:hypothetical protein BD414DRAFT_51369 [Trametes punicea]|nr:hypothetical protein BD414DRAFT_51369 [Trametes punicea]
MRCEAAMAARCTVACVSYSSTIVIDISTITMSLSSSQSPVLEASSIRSTGSGLGCTAASVLHIDILRLILACLSGPELLTMAYTSRAIREETHKEMLFRPITLSKRRGLESFYRFATAGNLGKLSLVRTLTLEHLHGPVVNQEERDALVSILKHCTNLRSLKLHWCDRVIEEETRLADVICSLPLLTQFHVRTYNNPSLAYAITFRMVTNMQSSLTSLNLPLGPSRQTAEDLRNLSKTHHRFEDLALYIDTLPASGVSFSSVHSLHLTFESELPSLHEIYATFPHVQKLQVTAHMYIDVAEFSAARQVAQSDYKAGESWPYLNFLHAPIQDIYALGISCPVRWVETGYYEVGYHDHLADIVSRLRPRTLGISLYCSPTLDDVPRSDPSVLLHDATTSGVKHLLVRLSFSKGRKLAASCVVKSLLPLLLSSRIELLNLVISPLFMSDDPNEIINLAIEVEPECEDLVRDIDVEIVARELVAGCPSIRTLAISMVSKGHNIWKVDRSNGGSTMVSLHPYEGRRLMEEEARRCLED